MEEGIIKLRHNIFKFAEQLYNIGKSEGELMKEKNYLSEHEYLARINDTLYLREPEELQLTYNKGQLRQIHIPEINLTAVGDSDEEVVADFRETIGHMWDFYGKEEDAKLTEGAIKIKRWLLSNIEER